MATIPSVKLSPDANPVQSGEASARRERERLLERARRELPGFGASAVLHENTARAVVELSLLFEWAASKAEHAAALRVVNLLRDSLPSWAHGYAAIIAPGEKAYHAATGDHLGEVKAVRAGFPGGPEVAVVLGSDLHWFAAADVCGSPEVARGAPGPKVTQEARVPRGPWPADETAAAGLAVRNVPMIAELLEQASRMLPPGSPVAATVLDPHAPPGSYGHTIRKMIAHLGEACDRVVEDLREKHRTEIADLRRNHRLAVEGLEIRGRELLASAERENKLRKIAEASVEEARADQRVAALSDRCGELDRQVAEALRLVGQKETQIAALERTIRELKKGGRR